MLIPHVSPTQTDGQKLLTVNSFNVIPRSHPFSFAFSFAVALITFSHGQSEKQS